jgi:cytoskeletal protein RodZ
METANFGTLLREEREKRHVSLAEVSQATKLSVSSLKLMEDGNLDDLPPDVFVRGFIRSYTKTLGMPSSEALGLFDEALAERRRASDLPMVTVAVRAKQPAPSQAVALPVPPMEDEAQSPRRGIGLAVFVIIVLLIATITLSLFLRQQPQSGEGLSLESCDVATARLSNRT